MKIVRDLKNENNGYEKIKNEVGMSWEMIKLGDVLEYEQPTNYIVSSDLYDDKFSTPVLTAGKSFILGYTDETEGIYSDLPVIIFDDFTTVSKYVDFPFKVKSSAMKILKAKDGIADTKFMYYLLQTLNFDCEQHKRYWISEFAPFQIPLPPLPVQKRIAEILDAADALRRKDHELLKKYDELAQAIFIDMFGDPVKNEKGWEVKKLEKLTTLITDGKHGNCNDSLNSGYYFISAKDIFNERINYNNSRQISKTEFEEIDRRTDLQAGDIVMVNTGATIGKLAIVDNLSETRRTTFQKSVAIIKLKKEIITPEFLKYVFMLRINSFSGKGTGSAVQNLLLSQMRDFNIISPDYKRQKDFSKKVRILEQQKNIAQKSLSESGYLFQTLLQQAFKGELVAE